MIHTLQVIGVILFLLYGMPYIVAYAVVITADWLYERRK